MIICSLSIIILLVIIFIVTNTNSRHTQQVQIPINVQPQKTEIDVLAGYPYERKDLFTKTEMIFFQILRGKCQEKNLMVFPKVRMEDYINVVGTKDILKYRGYIKSRHIDFIIADEQGNLKAAIELDDWTHENIKAKEKDMFKNTIMQKIGIPLYRVKVGENFEERINQILG